MPQGQGYSQPEQIPVVERCAKKVVSQSDKSKSEAIPICINTLKKSGRIKQNQNGQWVAVKQKQSKGGKRAKRG